MTFAAQEQLLFDLVFEPPLRQRFLQDAQQVLEECDLTAEEQHDFLLIDKQGLALDAAIRIDLLLGQWCKLYPMTFSLLSSVLDLKQLHSLVDAALMRDSLQNRIITVGNKCRAMLAAAPINNTSEKAIMLSIVDAELAMMQTATGLKQALSENKQPFPDMMELPADWQQRALQWGDYVSVHYLPQAWLALQKTLCPVAASALWLHLHKFPLTVSQRQEMMTANEKFVFLAKACVVIMACEQTVEHKTREVAEGFGVFFQYINGTTSVADLLQEMQSVGAQAAMLDSIANTFRQLISARFLVI